MGIDRHFADFMLCARENGTDFRQVATLGRLNLFIDHRSLRAVFHEHGIDLTDRDIRAIRSASDGYAEEFLRRLGAQRGKLPHPFNRPSGCSFHPRCPDRMARCSVVVPSRQPVGPQQLASCFLHHDLAEPA